MKERREKLKEHSFIIEENIWHLYFWIRLSCWNPWNKMEWKKSIEAYRESNPFFIEIIIALICIKMEWRLTLKRREEND